MRKSKLILVTMSCFAWKISSFTSTVPSSNRHHWALDHRQVSASTSASGTRLLASRSGPEKLTTRQHQVTISKPTIVKKSMLRRLFRKSGRSTTGDPDTTLMQFSYDYDVLQIGNEKNPATGIVLIHPIGVGIGKWFFQRLFGALSERESNASTSRQGFVVLAPDLIGSGGATNATIKNDESSLASLESKLPLFNISDWTDQVADLMAKTERDYPTIQRWCVVANGGCAPIALQVAERSTTDDAPFSCSVTNTVLSCTPRLPFFLNATDPVKVAKSYRTLCGLAGKLFWWYTCRNEGAFIQTFSEKNLVADPANLGSDWRPNCYKTAISNDGRSRYATFAFLAGTLQDGCVQSLEALKASKQVQIDIIKGRDARRNQAKSWFWQKRKRTASSGAAKTPRKTLRDYLEECGIGGREYLVGGRISLAHEDAPGYSDALMEYLVE